MDITIKINTDNDAFQESYYREIERVMDNVRDIVLMHGKSVVINRSVHDINGNKIGVVKKK
tara:strand:- start:54 stop:236 length:183 start_codon:yes stop_codon:yes gene_type:complete